MTQQFTENVGGSTALYPKVTVRHSISGRECTVTLAEPKGTPLVSGSDDLLRKVSGERIFLPTSKLLPSVVFFRLFKKRTERNRDPYQP